MDNWLSIETAGDQLIAGKKRGAGSQKFRQIVHKDASITGGKRGYVNFVPVKSGLLPSLRYHKLARWCDAHETDRLKGEGFITNDCCIVDVRL